jgi:hypothetical protein
MSGLKIGLKNYWATKNLTAEDTEERGGFIRKAGIQ